MMFTSLSSCIPATLVTTTYSSLNSHELDIDSNVSISINGNFTTQRPIQINQGDVVRAQIISPPLYLGYNFYEYSIDGVPSVFAVVNRNNFTATVKTKDSKLKWFNYIASNPEISFYQSPEKFPTRKLVGYGSDFIDVAKLHIILDPANAFINFYSTTYEFICKIKLPAGPIDYKQIVRTSPIGQYRQDLIVLVNNGKLYKIIFDRQFYESQEFIPAVTPFFNLNDLPFQQDLPNGGTFLDAARNIFLKRLLPVVMALDTDETTIWIAGSNIICVLNHNFTLITQFNIPDEEINSICCFLNGAVVTTKSQKLIHVSSSGIVQLFTSSVLGTPSNYNNRLIVPDSNHQRLLVFNDLSGSFTVWSTPDFLPAYARTFFNVLYVTGHDSIYSLKYVADDVYQSLKFTKKVTVVSAVGNSVIGYHYLEKYTTSDLTGIKKIAPIEFEPRRGSITHVGTKPIQVYLLGEPGVVPVPGPYTTVWVNGLENEPINHNDYVGVSIKALIPGVMRSCVVIGDQAIDYTIETETSKRQIDNLSTITNLNLLQSPFNSNLIPSVGNLSFGTTSINLPSYFTVYKKRYNSINVSTNGYLTFGNNFSTNSINTINGLNQDAIYAIREPLYQGLPINNVDPLNITTGTLTTNEIPGVYWKINEYIDFTELRIKWIGTAQKFYPLGNTIPMAANVSTTYKLPTGLYNNFNVNDYISGNSIITSTRVVSTSFYTGLFRIAAVDSLNNRYYLRSTDLVENYTEIFYSNNYVGYVLSNSNTISSGPLMLNKPGIRTILLDTHCASQFVSPFTMIRCESILVNSYHFLVEPINTNEITIPFNAIRSNNTDRIYVDASVAPVVTINSTLYSSGSVPANTRLVDKGSIFRQVTAEKNVTLVANNSILSANLNFANCEFPVSVTYSVTNFLGNADFFSQPLSGNFVVNNFSASITYTANSLIEVAAQTINLEIKANLIPNVTSTITFTQGINGNLLSTGTDTQNSSFTEYYLTFNNNVISDISETYSFKTTEVEFASSSNPVNEVQFINSTGYIDFVDNHITIGNTSASLNVNSRVQIEGSFAIVDTSTSVNLGEPILFKSNNSAPTVSYEVGLFYSNLFQYVEISYSNTVIATSNIGIDSTTTSNIIIPGNTSNMSYLFSSFRVSGMFIYQGTGSFVENAQPNDLRMPRMFKVSSSDLSELHYELLLDSKVSIGANVFLSMDYGYIEHNGIFYNGFGNQSLVKENDFVKLIIPFNTTQRAISPIFTIGDLQIALPSVPEAIYNTYVQNNILYINQPTYTIVTGTCTILYTGDYFIPDYYVGPFAYKNNLIFKRTRAGITTVITGRNHSFVSGDIITVENLRTSLRKYDYRDVVIVGPESLRISFRTNSDPVFNNFEYPILDQPFVRYFKGREIVDDGNVIVVEGIPAYITSNITLTSNSGIINGNLLLNIPNVEFIVDGNILYSQPTVTNISTGSNLSLQRVVTSYFESNVVVYQLQKDIDQSNVYIPIGQWPINNRLIPNIGIQDVISTSIKNNLNQQFLTSTENKSIEIAKEFYQGRVITEIDLSGQKEFSQTVMENSILQDIYENSTIFSFALDDSSRYSTEFSFTILEDSLLKYTFFKGGQIEGEYVQPSTLSNQTIDNPDSVIRYSLFNIGPVDGEYLVSPTESGQTIDDPDSVIRYSLFNIGPIDSEYLGLPTESGQTIEEPDSVIRYSLFKIGPIDSEYLGLPTLSNQTIDDPDSVIRYSLFNIGPIDSEYLGSPTESGQTIEEPDSVIRYSLFKIGPIDSEYLGLPTESGQTIEEPDSVIRYSLFNIGPFGMEYLQPYSELFNYIDSSDFIQYSLISVSPFDADYLKQYTELLNYIDLSDNNIQYSFISIKPIEGQSLGFPTQSDQTIDKVFVISPTVFSNTIEEDYLVPYTELLNYIDLSDNNIQYSFISINPIDGQYLEPQTRLLKSIENDRVISYTSLNGIINEEYVEPQTRLLKSIENDRVISYTSLNGIINEEYVESQTRLLKSIENDSVISYTSLIGNIEGDYVEPYNQLVRTIFNDSVISYTSLIGNIEGDYVEPYNQLVRTIFNDSVISYTSLIGTIEGEYSESSTGLLMSIIDPDSVISYTSLIGNIEGDYVEPYNQLVRTIFNDSVISYTSLIGNIEGEYSESNTKILKSINDPDSVVAYTSLIGNIEGEYSESNTKILKSINDPDSVVAYTSLIGKIEGEYSESNTKILKSINDPDSVVTYTSLIGKIEGEYSESYIGLEKTIGEPDSSVQYTILDIGKIESDYLELRSELVITNKNKSYAFPTAINLTNDSSYTNRHDSIVLYLNFEKYTKNDSYIADTEFIKTILTDSIKNSLNFVRHLPHDNVLTLNFVTYYVNELNMNLENYVPIDTSTNTFSTEFVLQENTPEVTLPLYDTTVNLETNVEFLWHPLLKENLPFSIIMENENELYHRHESLTRIMPFYRIDPHFLIRNSEPINDFKNIGYEKDYIPYLETTSSSFDVDMNFYSVPNLDSLEMTLPFSLIKENQPKIYINYEGLAVSQLDSVPVRMAGEKLMSPIDSVKSKIDSIQNKINYIIYNRMIPNFYQVKDIIRSQSWELLQENHQSYSDIKSNGSYDPTIRFFAVNKVWSRYEKDISLTKSVIEGNVLYLETPPGYVFSSVEFASFGLPEGSDGAYSINPNAHASGSLSIVKNILLGCTGNIAIPATEQRFGNLSTPGRVKRLTVSATVAPATRYKYQHYPTLIKQGNITVFNDEVIHYFTNNTTITFPQDTEIEIIAVGGGGGGGGGESTISVGGGGGGVVSGKYTARASIPLNIWVGGGGGGGYPFSGSGGQGLGGRNGGGGGGRAGKEGTSGGGGGGGGYSGVSLTNGTFLLVAGGGAGGGGGLEGTADNVPATGGGDQIAGTNPSGAMDGTPGSDYVFAISSGVGSQKLFNLIDPGLSGSPNYRSYQPQYGDYLIEYGVWELESSETIFSRSYSVNFPTTDTYVFAGSVDDKGNVYLDGTRVLELVNYALIDSAGIVVSAGTHTIDIVATNVGGPGSVAFTIEKAILNGGGGGGGGGGKVGGRGQLNLTKMDRASGGSNYINTSLVMPLANVIGREGDKRIRGLPGSYKVSGFDPELPFEGNSYLGPNNISMVSSVYTGGSGGFPYLFTTPLTGVVNRNDLPNNGQDGLVVIKYRKPKIYQEFVLYEQKYEYSKGSFASYTEAATEAAKYTSATPFLIPGTNYWNYRIFFNTHIYAVPAKPDAYFYEEYVPGLYSNLSIASKPSTVRFMAQTKDINDGTVVPYLITSTANLQLLSPNTDPTGNLTIQSNRTYFDLALINDNTATNSNVTLTLFGTGCLSNANITIMVVPAGQPSGNALYGFNNCNVLSGNVGLPAIQGRPVELPEFFSTKSQVEVKDFSVDVATSYEKYSKYVTESSTVPLAPTFNEATNFQQYKEVIDFAYRMSPLKIDQWQVGSGPIPEYNFNQTATGENALVLDTDPWGNTKVIWETRASGDGNADGGWNHNYFAIDNNKTYRSTVWVRRTSTTSGGVVYHGLFTNGSAATYPNPYYPSGSVIRLTDGLSEGNPYWDYASASTYDHNVWYLLVGYIFPAGYPGSVRHPESGVYTRGQGKVFENRGNIPQDGRFPSNATQAMQRCYHYYCSDSTTTIQFAYPKFEEVTRNILPISIMLEFPPYEIPQMYNKASTKYVVARRKTWPILWNSKGG